MKLQAYRIQKYENPLSWNSGWVTKKDKLYCLTAVKKEAKKMAAQDPKASWRVLGEDGRCYWEHN